MKYNTYTLSNGLRVIHICSQSPVIYCGYVVAVGARDENKEQEGLAHFCEHVTFKGTERRSALQVINYLENVGGDLNAFTNKEDTVYHATILKEYLPQAIDILTDIVFHSTYPQDELNKEVEVICDEIETYNDTPSELIYDEFDKILFCNHTLGHSILGTVEKLKTYKSEDIKIFTQQYYRANNTVFFAYGDVNFNLLIKLLERNTSSLPHTTQLIRNYSIPPSNLYTTQKEYFLNKGTHLSHVITGCITFSAVNNRRTALYLLNNILGGPGMNSRLNISLRERRGLVYTVESSMICYRDTGVWSAYFGCEAQNVRRCKALLAKEIDRITQHPLSQRQLNAAKKQIKGQIAIACDYRENFAIDVARNYLHYSKVKNIEELFAKIDALTATELQDVAQQIFATENLISLTFS